MSYLIQLYARPDGTFQYGQCDFMPGLTSLFPGDGGQEKRGGVGASSNIALYLSRL